MVSDYFKTNNTLQREKAALRARVATEVNFMRNQGRYIQASGIPHGEHMTIYMFGLLYIQCGKSKKGNECVHVKLNMITLRYYSWMLDSLPYHCHFLPRLTSYHFEKDKLIELHLKIRNLTNFADVCSILELKVPKLGMYKSQPGLV